MFINDQPLFSFKNGELSSLVDSFANVNARNLWDRRKLAHSPTMGNFSLVSVCVGGKDSTFLVSSCYDL